MKDIGGIKVKTGDMYEEEFEFEIKAADDKVVNDLGKFKISGFLLIGDLVGIGFKSLNEFKVSGESFGVLDNDNDVCLTFRFIDEIVVVTSVMRLENMIRY